ncbi:probable metal-binding protein [Ferrimonas sediminum]|uniref:Probable metal-binding protein n=1 Tax=Ferrimonas sediminum TaxID=718193 RepID=A0A1G8M244_9GAMM|nr:YecH family metal-binding protein [Ferrimonas sediminum]SDI62011.1 probable metal-binding protein [Ferrimonas sediminum]
MTESIHAHELLNLIGEQDKPLTLPQIEDLAVNQFGAEARFHTCRLSDQSIEQILTFFVKMEKIATEGEGYALNRGNMCSH